MLVVLTSQRNVHKEAIEDKYTAVTSEYMKGNSTVTSTITGLLPPAHPIVIPSLKFA